MKSPNVLEFLSNKMLCLDSNEPILFGENEIAGGDRCCRISGE
ncbi:MAG: hypothetical protein SGI77_01430 [Pirellulaceae bacterium]|nr:hypothetical protein [Pirellulaceae bacterium]